MLNKLPINIKFFPFPHFFDIHEEYSKVGNQKKETCGSFTLAYMLRGLGFERTGYNEVYEDYVASIARVNIMLEEAEKWKDAMEKIRNGELTKERARQKYGDILYDFELPVAKEPKEAGGSAEGVRVACERITDGKIMAIPIPAREEDKIYFTQNIFSKLVKLIRDFSDEWNIEMIANYNTGHLLDVEDESYNLINIILHWNDTSFFPTSKWIVGHFVNIAGFVEFKVVNKKSVYVLIRDTYKHFGFGGYHLQPLENFRRALVRNDGREGGLLITAPTENRKKIEGAITNLGLSLGVWDNGSPFR